MLVVGAKNQVMVLATGVKKEDAHGTSIINHVRKYPLGCTIPCTHYILLFFLTNTLFILKRKKRADAKSVMNLATNTLIAVTVATSTFT